MHRRLEAEIVRLRHDAERNGATILALQARREKVTALEAENRTLGIKVAELEAHLGDLPRWEDGRVAALEAEVVGKQKTIIELARKVDRFRNHLESLTPGGSEFHNDPVRCVEWVHERTSSAISQVLKRKAAAEAEAERLRGALRGVLILAEDDLRLCREGYYTSQIEANARAALEPLP